MTSLVTLDEAKAHLRIDHDDEDESIELQIEAASAAVLNYIGDAQYLFLDTGGDELMLDPATEQEGLRAQQLAHRATLLLVGDFFKNREPTPDDVVDPRFGYGYLPRAVVALLTSLRQPTIA
jgi:hypothetical protein